MIDGGRSTSRDLTDSREDKSHNGEARRGKERRCNEMRDVEQDSTHENLTADIRCRNGAHNREKRGGGGGVARSHGAQWRRGLIVTTLSK